MSNWNDWRGGRQETMTTVPNLHLTIFLISFQECLSFNKYESPARQKGMDSATKWMLTIWEPLKVALRLPISSDSIVLANL
jgi:hypothetical protein